MTKQCGSLITVLAKVALLFNARVSEMISGVVILAVYEGGFCSKAYLHEAVLNVSYFIHNI